MAAGKEEDGMAITCELVASKVLDDLDIAFDQFGFRERKPGRSCRNSRTGPA